jgi:hypothetical protein
VICVPCPQFCVPEPTELRKSVSAAEVLWCSDVPFRSEQALIPGGSDRRLKSSIESVSPPSRGIKPVCRAGGSRWPVLGPAGRRGGPNAVGCRIRSGLVELFNDQADEDLVPGVAVMAGAAFLPDVFKTQGMDFFAESPTYRGIALHLLDLRKLADFGSDNEDPASRLMSQWILERQDSLPEVLDVWRRAGAAIGRAHGLTPSRSRPRGSGRTVPKNASCPCGSGRKAGRCHPGGLPDPAR